MTVNQRRTSFSFDTASLLLFAALSMGGAATAFAQTGGPSFGPGPSGTAQPAASSPVSQAFDRADTNKDGKLSPQEAAMLPAVGNRFAQLDTDKDGALSREEFEKGVTPQAK
ncbi:MAG: EF-hand domain-containing protein [Burkholderiaceae bacterium]|nr:MAG: EF-hand domain-containing protein [Burkholderiaceae bacterium]